MKEITINLNTPIGAQFKALREEKDVSIREMEGLTDVSLESLSNWEKGTGPFIRTQKTNVGLNSYALKYCKVLGIETVNFKPFNLKNDLCKSTSIN